MLLVGGCPSLARLLRRRLVTVQENTVVEHAASLASALARLGRCPAPACIVVDLDPDDATGHAALGALRREAQDVPMVVLTGHAESTASVGAGPLDRVPKAGLTPGRLAGVVRRAIERSRRRLVERERARLDAHLQLVLDTTADGVVSLDRAQHVRDVNAAAMRLLGSSPEALLGVPLHEAVHPRCVDANCPLAEAIAAREDAELACELERPDRPPARVRLRMRRAQGTDASGAGFLLTFTDLTGDGAAEHARRALETQLDHAEALAGLGSWRQIMRTGQTTFSAGLSRVTGLPAVRPESRTGAFDAYLALVLPEDRPRASALLRGTAPRDELRLPVRHRLRRTDGQLRWLQLRRTEVGCGDDVLVVGTVQDVTDQVESEQAMSHAAAHDWLTGLPNRAGLSEHLTAGLHQVRAGGAALAILFVDLDHFKAVNDELGHAVGDQVLRSVVERMAGVLRPTDVLTRFGGDEFVIVCPDVTSVSATQLLAERLVDELSRPVEAGHLQVTVTASVGVVTVDSASGADADTLLRRADAAMYRAKTLGRSRVEMGTDVSTPLRPSPGLQRELRTALEHGGGIVVYYQPVLALGASDRVVAAEALVRWQHPTRGLLPPATFLPLAEECGLSGALLQRVVAHALDQLARWPDMDIAVNLSAQQLRAPHLVEQVRDLVQGAGRRAERLTVELAERTLTADLEVSRAVVTGLHDLGIATAVDDFGTAATSLDYLHTLPVDTVKVGPRFTAELASGGAGAAVVRLVSGLARTLSMAVVAEGVEQPAQRARLVDLGVQRAQGFLWARAEPPDGPWWVAACAAQQSA